MALGLRYPGPLFLAALAAALLGSAAAATPPGAAAAAPAKTYFLSSAGSDGNPGTAGSPWATFRRAWRALVPGDTLIVADGDYSNASPPPGFSGSAERDIGVRAANPGGARLFELAFKGNAHLTFVGFRVSGVGRAVDVSSNGPGKASHHLTFREIGFSCAPALLNDGACFAIGDGTHHLLLEDSWGFGGGRYTVLCYGGPGGRPANLTCDHNTFRRLVLRMGPARSSRGNPQASLALYYASSNLVENVIALDGKAASDSSNAAFYITGHAPPPTSDFNRFFGVIALGNLGVGFYLDCNGAVCNAAKVHNSVFWGSSRTAVSITGGRGAGDSCESVVIDHNTIATAGDGFGYGSYACRNATLTNNAIYSNSGDGARQSQTSGSTAAHHNGYFGNRLAARSNVPAGAGDLTSNPGFVYITRIETSSPYRNAGSTGDIGANVTHRYEGGTLTPSPLWPWPNEARIKREMCADSSFKGGLCAAPSLTHYVWQYLGNPMPSDLQSGSSQ